MQVRRFGLWWAGLRRVGVWLLGGLLLAACAEAAPAAVNSTAALATAPEFEPFYTAHGALRTFGYPLTDSFVDPGSGRTVQYFQNLRLEVNPANEQVEVTPLGAWAMAEVGRDVAATDTSLSAALPFRDFYEQYGGEALFGPAISGQVEEGGRWVQYFGNARLEWQGEALPEWRVQAAQLGQAHFLRSGAVYTYHQQRRGQDFIPDDLAGLRQVNVSAAAAYPILFAGDEQRLYVTALTPDGYPAAGAAVRAMLTYADGKTQSVEMPATDRAGKTTASITLAQFTPGEAVWVQIVVESSAGEPLGRYELRFRMWW